MAELSERKKKILTAVIEEYIENAEPVGSKLLAQKAGLKVSSATIRNELAELTNLGYLEQPHTSAGRVPTALGYRLYVNELMDRKSLSPEETGEIDRELRDSGAEPERIMTDAGRLAAKMTDYPALTLSARSPDTVRRFDLLYVDANTIIIVVLLGSDKVKNKLVRLPFSVDQAMIRKLSTVFNTNFCGITEEEITPERIAAAERVTGDAMGLCAAIAAFALEALSESRGRRAVFSGGAKLLRQPEFRDPDKAHSLMNWLSDAEHLHGLSGGESFGEDVKVLIGPENVAEELKDSSVILAKYDAGDGMQGVIGVIGPTRMDYSRIAAKLSYIADGLSKALAGAERGPLPGFGKLMLADQNEWIKDGRHGSEEAREKSGGGAGDSGSR